MKRFLITLVLIVVALGAIWIYGDRIPYANQVIAEVPHLDRLAANDQAG